MKDIKLRLVELQAKNGYMRKIGIEKLSKNLKSFNKVLYYSEFFYVSKIIWNKLINRYYNNLLVDYFGIKKTYRYITRRYYQKSLYYNIKIYIRDCNIYLIYKIVSHKLYKNL